MNGRRALGCSHHHLSLLLMSWIKWLSVNRVSTRVFLFHGITGTNKVSCDDFALHDFMVAVATASSSHSPGSGTKWGLLFPVELLVPPAARRTLGQQRAVACLSETLPGLYTPIPLRQAQGAQCCPGETRSFSINPTASRLCVGHLWSPAGWWWVTAPPSLSRPHSPKQRASQTL